MSFCCSNGQILDHCPRMQSLSSLPQLVPFLEYKSHSLRLQLIRLHVYGRLDFGLSVSIVFFVTMNVRFVFNALRKEA